uniref:Uncharacterized protein n=1 Tax=Anguilla anguilla TaxID=7936 RepID=A0A0E9RSX9_ANGAN
MNAVTLPSRAMFSLVRLFALVCTAALMNDVMTKNQWSRVITPISFVH